MVIIFYSGFFKKLIGVIPNVIRVLSFQTIEVNNQIFAVKISFP